MKNKFIEMKLLQTIVLLMVFTLSVSCQTLKKQKFQKKPTSVEIGFFCFLFKIEFYSKHYLAWSQ